MVHGRTGVSVNFELNRTLENSDEVVVDNAMTLATGLAKILNMKAEERMAMGKSGREFAISAFNPAQLIEKHEQLLKGGDAPSSTSHNPYPLPVPATWSGAA